MQFIKNLIRDFLLSRFKAPRDMINWACRHYGARTAIRTEKGTELSFTEVGEKVLRLANGLLDSGLNPGDRVAFMLPNSPEFVLLRLACYEAGLVSVPLIWDLPEDTRPAILEHVDAKILFYDPALDPQAATRYPNLKTIAIPEEDNTAFNKFFSAHSTRCKLPINPKSASTINCTSGTTGISKGVVSTHGSQITSVRMLVKTSNLKPQKYEAILHCIPLATAGWGVMIPTFLAGVTNVVMREYSVKLALELAEINSITRTFMTPSQLVDWLDHPDFDAKKLPRLSNLYYGTSPLYGAKQREAIDRLGPIIRQGYGLAEVLPPVAFLDGTEHDPEHAPYRAGHIAEGVTVRIVDTDGRDVTTGERGEVYVKSPIQTPGYYNRPDLTTEAIVDGFFNTGDIGYFDGDGYINVLGRKKEMLPGIEEHPREIEERLHWHPAIKECAMIRIDEQNVLAYSLRWGKAAPNESDLREKVKADENIKLFRVDGDLPRSAAGKIVRWQLAQDIEKSIK